MLRTSILLCTASAAALSLVESPAVNDYELVATGKDCPQDGRINLPCGNCGPNWGGLDDCETECNYRADCTHLTYFDDDGCRLYSSCNLDRAAAPVRSTKRSIQRGDDQPVPNVGTSIYARRNPSPLQRPIGPCDILQYAGTPCVAAHSLVRAMYANFTGALYRVLRDSDKAALDIPMGPAGFPRTDQQDTFCNQTECYVVRIYDQSPMRNHLDTSPPGECCHFPLKPVNAKRDPISIAGTERTVYGAYFEGNMGYRNDVTSGVATGEMEQTMYMVTRGDHVNGGCCFDYGNAETDNDDDGEGTMEAIYFGTSTGWGHGQGDGPWVMADLENGLWAGDVKDAPAPSITFKYVTAMAKGKKGGFALKGGNAQEGQLQTLHEGKRPNGYATMKKQGAIILGIGGDNSCSAIGTFYEGAMTASYTSDATDDAVQANIVAAGYGK